jgi:hypothetical protein
VLTFLQLVEIPPAQIVPVDCPTCPINMSCIAGSGGTGWRFDCCGSSGFTLQEGTLFVDCGINRFEQHDKAKEFRTCPVCNGGIMEVVEAGRWGELQMGTNYYLPTVHARIRLADRLILLREKQAQARLRLNLAQDLTNKRR